MAAPAPADDVNQRLQNIEAMLSTLMQTSSVMQHSHPAAQWLTPTDHSEVQTTDNRDELRLEGGVPATTAAPPSSRRCRTPPDPTSPTRGVETTVAAAPARSAGEHSQRKGLRAQISAQETDTRGGAAVVGENSCGAPSPHFRTFGLAAFLSRRSGEEKTAAAAPATATPKQPQPSSALPPGRNQAARRSVAASRQKPGGQAGATPRKPLMRQGTRDGRKRRSSLAGNALAIGLHAMRSESEEASPSGRGSADEGAAEEPPPTLEDFVQGVLETGAEQKRRIEKLVRWYMRRQKLQRWYPVLYPGSLLNDVWEYVLCLSIIPYVILMPLVLGFPHYAAVPLRPLLLLLDGLYWLGILLTFGTAILPSNDDIMIRKPLEIARHYATTTLLPDVIGGLPYYYVLCGLNSQCPSSSSNLFMAPSLSLLCGLRLARIARAERARALLLLPRKGDNVLAFGHAGGATLLRLFGLFLWLSHACGCLYWYTSLSILGDGLNGVGHDGTPVLTWGTHSEWLPRAHYAQYLRGTISGLDALLSNTTSVGSEQRTGFDSYLYAFVWGMVHVSGIQFNLPEDEPRGLTCCALVAFAAIATNATLIGSVTTTLTRINAYASKEQRGREALTAWCMQNQVPEPLQQRIHAYYDFAGGVSRQRKDLLPALPKELGFQLEIFLKRTLFLSTPFFQGCDFKQIIMLVPMIRSEHMMPGVIICREGAVLEGLYLVARGRVLLLEGDAVAGIRFAGGFVGEQALVSRGAPSKYQCMCGDWSELMLLRADDFRTLTKAFPELQQRVAMYARGKESLKKDVLASQEQQLRINQQCVRKPMRGSVCPAGATRGALVAETTSVKSPCANV